MRATRIHGDQHCTVFGKISLKSRFPFVYALFFDKQILRPQQAKNGTTVGLHVAQAVRAVGLAHGRSDHASRGGVALAPGGAAGLQERRGGPPEQPAPVLALGAAGAHAQDGPGLGHDQARGGVAASACDESRW